MKVYWLSIDLQAVFELCFDPLIAHTSAGVAHYCMQLWLLST